MSQNAKPATPHFSLLFLCLASSGFVGFHLWREGVLECWSESRIYHVRQGRGSPSPVNASAKGEGEQPRSHVRQGCGSPRPVNATAKGEDEQPRSHVRQGRGSPHQRRSPSNELTHHQISVAFTSAWPSRSWMVRKSLPHSSRWVANASLKPCEVMRFSIPAS